jgi:hypothetical protein
VQSLIIGRRDLRPILSRVPPGAQALVALDSCYSENAAKSVGVWSTAPVRGINLVARVQEQNKQAGDAASADAARMPASGGAEGGSYPYSNVVSFAAASKDQAAVDIGSDFLMRKWPTVDGKPHGAFTNSLLAGLAGAGDTNRDGSITYDELFRFIRRDTWRNTRINLRSWRRPGSHWTNRCWGREPHRRPNRLCRGPLETRRVPESG